MGEKKYVSYLEFGAAGDGITDDFRSIYEAHKYANEHHLPVMADKGKSFLLHDSVWDGEIHEISVKTDTDWSAATVIMDDTDISAKNKEADKRYLSRIFVIESYFPSVSIEQKYIDKINAEGGISKESTKKLDLGLGYPAMLAIFNEGTRHFIRYGSCAGTGAAQKELIIVDAEGNIDKDAPLLFDFEAVTKIVAYRIDIPELTFEAGTVITRSSRVNMYPAWAYTKRGICVTRPHTHIKNLYHKIEGELDKYEPVYEDASGIARSAVPDGFSSVGDKIYKNGEEYGGTDVKPFTGLCYSGIIDAHDTHDVLLENVSFQSRIYYLQGTYDFCASMVNLVVLKNCRQSNFYAGDKDNPKMPTFGRWWGVAGTNYCKNMVYDGCLMTRYDAHCGVVNGKIINSTLGAICLTGGGDMLIENSKILYWDGSSPITMRDDYGATWCGTITVRNCEYLAVKEGTVPKQIIGMKSANHYFGYKTYSPNIVIDNLKIEYHEKEVPLYTEKPLIWRDFFYRAVNDAGIRDTGAICGDGKPNVNPYTPPEFIRVINNEGNGYTVTVPDAPLFRDTEITGAVKK